MRRLLLGLLLCCAQAVSGQPSPYRDELIARSRGLGLAQERRWLRLLHYRRHGRRWRSEADGAKFYLSPLGRNDPQAELEADLSAFFAPAPQDPKDQHPQCRFPARYAWLKDRLAIDPSRLPGQACPDFEAWREAISARAVSLVFADAFLGNPSSMFGHTFLRLEKDPEGGGDALLDYTLNFEATPNTDNPFVYTLKGLDGSFPGEYSLTPFYLKTQEYSNLERRDLWDYPLKLSQGQIDSLIKHGWEMGSTYFDYYFFTKNCSYQLLTLLEAVDDSLDVSGSFHLGVVPADTVRALRARGLTGPVRYRPSFVTELTARRQRLSPEELAAASRLGRRTDVLALSALQAFPPQRQALVLDSAHDLLRLRNGFYLEQSTATKEAEHALLVARGRLGQPPLPAEVPRPQPLEAGHDTARASLGFGVNGKFSFEELSWRPVLHDLPADDAGYTPDSQLEALNTRLRFDNSGRRPYLERLDVVDIVALSPWDAWSHQASWRASTGVDQAKELGCNGPSCMDYDLGGGVGMSTRGSLLWRELFYAMAVADFGAAPAFDLGWRVGTGAAAGLVLQLTPSWKTLVEATYVDYKGSPAQERLRLETAWALSRDAEVRATLDRRVPDKEAGLSFHLYF